ncbi:MAG: acetyltransferase [Chloroflexi bacterium]|nr:acetyltransferase [Chloroflexota bacterium]
MFGRRLPYLPGIDGLRALAVLAVLVYHADRNWLPGGFLGVEVFFVISGYLITSILLSEWREHGGFSLRAFWLGRARRLLPALFFMTLVVLAFAVLFLPGEVARLRSDTAAAAGYATNWYLIFDHQSYFESFGRPSLLRHLWSLAVEEQFYLVWPVLLALGLRYLRPRGVLLALLLGAAASATAMALLYRPGADPSRIYYGTDTRAAALLIGAALAFLWAPGQVTLRGRAGAAAADAAGLIGLAVLAYLHFRLGESDRLLYQGGFAMTALATALVIAAAVQPEGRAGRVLGVLPLKWVGLRSYAIYLWHWPVFLLTRPQVDVPLDGVSLLALRLAITVALAEVSYHLVEVPVRTGVLGRAWEALRDGLRVRGWRLGLQYGAAVLAVLLSCAMLGTSVINAERPGPPPYLAAQKVHISAWSNTPDTTLAMAGSCLVRTCRAQSPKKSSKPGAKQGPTPSQQTRAKRKDSSTAKPAATGTAAPTAAATPVPSVTSAPSPIAVGRVTALGDSVMLGSADQLAQTIQGVSIDAEVGRQASSFIELLGALKANGYLAKRVVLHVGNNGVITESEFDEMMSILADVPQVVFVNVKVPREWEGPNNAVLAEGVKRYPNAVLIDWYGASVDHPEFFWDDGIHLRPEGGLLYANLIAAALAE